MILFFAPDHLVDDGDIALDDLDHDCADVLAHVDVDGGAVVVVAVHGNGCLHGLKQRLFVNACKDEAGVIEAFRALG